MVKRWIPQERQPTGPRSFLNHNAVEFKGHLACSAGKVRFLKAAVPNELCFFGRNNTRVAFCGEKKVGSSFGGLSGDGVRSEGAKMVGVLGNDTLVDGSDALVKVWKFAALGVGEAMICKLLPEASARRQPRGCASPTLIIRWRSLGIFESWKEPISASQVLNGVLGLEMGQAMGKWEAKCEGNEQLFEERYPGLKNKFTKLMEAVQAARSVLASSSASAAFWRVKHEGGVRFGGANQRRVRPVGRISDWLITITGFGCRRKLCASHTSARTVRFKHFGCPPNPLNLRHYLLAQPQQKMVYRGTIFLSRIPRRPAGHCTIPRAHMTPVMVSAKTLTIVPSNVTGANKGPVNVCSPSYVTELASGFAGNNCTSRLVFTPSLLLRPDSISLKAVREILENFY
ncbi:hypothetical protein C8J57DRAFT_1237644 [Mycena rebaudengoi]|nr:hypothetical protein C8J57DRAFT_1237644 [Mycena rebaudengoi]